MTNQNNFSEILAKTLTPDVLGIIWITDKQFIDYPYPYHELDYYLDGLLTEYSKGPLDKKLQKHFFFNESFSHPFFVLHLNPSKKTSPKEIRELKNIIDNLNQTNCNEIVILHHKECKTTPKIKKEFSKLTTTSIII